MLKTNEVTNELYKILECHSPLQIHSNIITFVKRGKGQISAQLRRPIPEKLCYQIYCIEPNRKLSVGW